jgi:hypothetical protein
MISGAACKREGGPVDTHKKSVDTTTSVQHAVKKRVVTQFKKTACWHVNRKRKSTGACPHAENATNPLINISIFHIIHQCRIMESPSPTDMAHLDMEIDSTFLTVGVARTRPSTPQPTTDVAHVAMWWWVSHVPNVAVVKFRNWAAFGAKSKPDNCSVGGSA